MGLCSARWSLPLGARPRRLRTFRHGPGADVGGHTAPLLRGALVAGLQLNAIAGEVAQARDDQRLLVHHLLEGPGLLLAAGHAGGGDAREAGCRGHQCGPVRHLAKGPAFPGGPGMTRGPLWSGHRWPTATGLKGKPSQGRAQRCPLRPPLCLGRGQSWGSEVTGSSCAPTRPPQTPLRIFRVQRSRPPESAFKNKDAKSSEPLAFQESPPRSTRPHPKPWTDIINWKGEQFSLLASGELQNYRNGVQLLVNKSYHWEKYRQFQVPSIQPGPFTRPPP